MNLPADYLVIELDDGDSRDFHVDSIRYLPSDYPITGKYLGYNRILNKLDIQAKYVRRLKPNTGYPAR